MCRRTAVPFVALLAATLLGIVVAAQAGLSFCNNRIAVSLLGDDLLICPCVLTLIVVTALLAGVAIVVLWSDPHRALARRAIVRTLARLPLGRTACGLTLAGAGVQAAMLAIDRSGAPSPAACALLGALLVAASLGAALLAIFAARVTLDFGRRLILAIVRAFRVATRAAAPRARRFAPALAAGRGVPLLAAGRGLRAPPSFVR